MTDYVATLKSALADRYTIEQTVGAGGMAVVYLAHDQKHDRQVAIKVLRPELSAAIGGERFLEEIRIEASLQHPLIVPLYDSGEANGLLFYVMPYIEGETLAERLLRETQLPISDALNVVRDVGGALAYAHEHGVVHRDVKPANIFLTGQHAMVADFGIARALELTGGERLTSTGLAVGTPAYMSPEQASGSEDLDGRADIYSLGCVLHEMLTGTPPFTGSTPRAVVARHAQENPPAIKTVRPTVPDWVEEAVQISLAKVPADRFPTVAEFVQTMETEGVGLQRAVEGRRRLSRRTMSAAVVAGLVVLTAVGTWKVVRMPEVQLDQRRVVVFAPEDNMLGQSDGGVGEGVAMAIGYALEGTRPLKWIEGDDWLAPDERVNRALVTSAVKRNVSTSQGAAYYIDGSIRREADSATIILRLWDVAGDSLVDRAASSAEVATASFARLGVRAVSALLPALLEPGRRVDVTALAERDAAAIANWLQGEAAYRSANFQAAFDHFSRAVEQDSALVLAAVGGSQAATWLEKTTPSGVATDMLAEAEELVQIAINNEQFLPERHAHFAYGLRFFLKGNADSAVARLTRALEVKPDWAEGWMTLGEVYHHLLPTMWTDSSAELAYTNAVNVDSRFTPPLPHLAEYAMRRGELDRAEALVERFGRAAPDNPYEMQHSLMLQCLRTGSTSVSWDEIAERDAFEVLATANLLARSVLEPQCASDAYRAVLNAGSAISSETWGALVGLQSLLVAQGMYDEHLGLLESDGTATTGGRLLYVIDAVAGAPFETQADGAVRDWGEDYDEMISPQLWAYGSWAARRGGVEQVESIARVLAERAESPGARGDILLADIMDAYKLLMIADSQSSIERFRSLKPTGSEVDLAWSPWESLGAERLTLARLLLATGEFEEAHNVAGLIDQLQPLAYMIYLPASLEIRLEAAEAMERPDLASRYMGRMERLQSQER